MRYQRKLALGLVLISGFGASACSDVATFAEPAPERMLLRAFFSESPAPGMTALRRTVPLPHDMSVTAEFDADNSGWLRLPKAGIRVRIPAGAIDLEDDIEITLTALAGDFVAFEFAPHGISFEKQLKIKIDVEGTEAEYLLEEDTPDGLLPGFLGVYWEGLPDEGVDALQSFPVNYKNGRLIFKTDHFSGYAIASG